MAQKAEKQENVEKSKALSLGSQKSATFNGAGAERAGWPKRFLKWLTYRPDPSSSGRSSCRT